MSKQTPSIATAALLLFSCSAALAANPSFSNQTTAAGINHVFNPGGGYTHFNYTGGGAVGDFDRDGFEDLLVLHGNGRDLLYMNNGNGTFTDEALSWGLTDVHKGKGASVGDFNGDGWLDIYVTSAGATGSYGSCKHRLYRNNGDGTFTNVAHSAGVDCTAPTEDGFGSTFGDYDLDGDLDLFVAGFASSNQGSRLFRNNGNETFTDVTAAIGFFTGVPGMSSFTPRFIDTNADDYPEMLLEADFNTEHFFRNNRDGTFSNISGKCLGGSNAGASCSTPQSCPGGTCGTGTGHEENGMGQTTGDFNNDGWIDSYVTSIYHPVQQVGWSGNKLYLNDGDGSYHFSDVSTTANVYKGGYGWGTLAVDFNHDGWQDIAETNGDNNSDGIFFNEQSYLWRNNGNGTFTEMAIAAGLVSYGKGRGMVNFDYDNDGDQDVVIFANAEAVELFRNDLSGPDTSWLRVKLDTRSSAAVAPGGTGSRVWATTAATGTQLRYMASGDNFLSHSELTAHFGLGSASLVDLLRVHWPDGGESWIEDVEVDQNVTLVARGACLGPPPAVGGLVVTRVGDELHLTWTDAGDPDEYVVLADSSPRPSCLDPFSGCLQLEDTFPLVVGTASSGVTGVSLEMPVGDRYFLVMGRQGGCIGP